MKICFKVMGIWLSLITIVSAGCATAPLPPRQQFIDQAIWPKTTRDKVFNACLTALTLEGFDIHPLATSKENGLIVTGKRKFFYEGQNVIIRQVICYYSLQLIVNQTGDNRVMLAVHVKPGWKHCWKRLNLTGTTGFWNGNSKKESAST